VWGVGVRTVIVFHATWFVNSASHTWGYQNYTEMGNDSTNLWWVALLSFGEGWHNNHHRYPRSAAHGLRRFELDPTWWTIQALAKVGLARDIHTVPAEQIPGASPASADASPADQNPEAGTSRDDQDEVFTGRAQPTTS
jgi:stearoyl-CoA desaturase (delta-9 desaturase)